MVVECKVEILVLKLPNRAFELNVPKAAVLFPRLKKISLICTTLHLSWMSLKNLIMGCRVLEELDSSLKRLKICSRKTSKFEVVIHEYRYMQDYCIFPPHIPAKPLSFVEVYHIKLIGCTSHATFFSYIAEAKILTLTNSSLEALILQGLDKYTLSNVVKLMIDNISTWNSLLVLLNSVPNLEHITFSDVSNNRFG
nr:hypothetical protein [Tanacetum cinerariifolium]